MGGLFKGPKAPKEDKEAKAAREAQEAQEQADMRDNKDKMVLAENRKASGGIRAMLQGGSAKGHGSNFGTG